MSIPTPNEQSLSEHTFGRDHYSPPPLPQEQAPHTMQTSASEDEWDLLQRIRNVGEW